MRTQVSDNAYASYPTPGLPELDGRMLAFKAEGPISAKIVAVLWDWLLCRVGNTGREERAERVYEEYKPTVISPAGTPHLLFETEKTISLDTIWNIPRALPDRFWNRLFMESSLQFPFPVHAALWAPFCDERGEFPEKNLSEIYERVIPPHIRNREPDYNRQRFFQAVFSGTAPTYVLRMPHLRISCQTPAWVHEDRDGLIHNQIGPSRVWSDGSNTYSWRGMLAPCSWFLPPTRSWLEENKSCPVPLPRNDGHKLPTAWEALSIRNIELRRVACEILGYDAIVTTLKGVVIDQNEDPQIGTLIRVRIPVPTWGDRVVHEDAMFLRVQCGTGRFFSLAVPPDMKTAVQANAWTYGLDPEEYAPEVRT